MSDLHKLAKAMCSIDLAESHWTQVSHLIKILILSQLNKKIIELTLQQKNFHLSQELPRLPVPDLWLTVSRYLNSLKAVLDPESKSSSSSSSAKNVGTEKDKKSLEVAQCDANNNNSNCFDNIIKLSKEQIEANRRQYNRTDQVVKQFMLHEGPQLQRDLKEYANKCQNWVSFSPLQV